ncbi:YifB family Mg chelatase-like AAA ATPase [Alkaliphilus serpentinus]|uniref:YifB family Mg chelatase-like AAA ATPase n=1 Tax=Alkaliphilus serpentinus TaxID=1482731 RepID=A0A833HQT9_9FIRM|nr:YifB family Mg chelatase-like AAA ATPase [Alkaliphilus serpentinus]KAB3531401.1 YifB family Mg chelatase-like AAA ATPase [Alkaliphilus serpentinus]
MLSKIKSSSFSGLDVSPIDVEVDLSNGLPAMNIVGLADIEVKESKERVRAAIKNSSFEFPLKRITINLAPADAKKEGTHYDLPIAIGILKASGQIKKELAIEDHFILGELSLDGKINRIKGVLPMLLGMQGIGISKVLLPMDNLSEGKYVPGIECIGVETLKDLVDYLNGELELSVQIGRRTENFKMIEGVLDFNDIMGQENLKRAMEIAAAGSHNLLMIGPPGSGKTMAARRLPSILPRMSYEEAIEVTKIYSVAGLLDPKEGLVSLRPFRSPHHTISNVALTGGGRIPKPGEVSLSHNGVLFLDELPEFNKMALEVLRQPIEDGEISVSRVNGSFTFPSKFMLVASMNPCPCGFFGTKSENQCSCSHQHIKRYLGKISGPLLDRIDLIVETASVEFVDLAGKSKSESSETIRNRVEAAREAQRKRYEESGFLNNSQLTPAAIRKHCKLDSEAKNLMEVAFNKLKLSGRGYNRVLKVARTIADLDGSPSIQVEHISEALQYRNGSQFFKF